MSANGWFNSQFTDIMNTEIINQTVDSPSVAKEALLWYGFGVSRRKRAMRQHFDRNRVKMNSMSPVTQYCTC